MRVFLALLLSANLIWGQSAKELLAQGRSWDAENRNQEALVVFLKANEIEPGEGETLRLIAKQYSQLIQDAKSKGEKKKLGQLALDYALEAAELAPDDAASHLTLAVVYGRIAQLAPARRKVELSKLIREEAALAARLDPQSDYAWHVLGRWNYELANFNPLLKGLAQVIYGKFPAASNAQAITCFQKAIAANPNRVIHRIELGRCYLALGDQVSARREIEKGLSLPSRAKEDEETKTKGRELLRQLE